MCFFKKKSLITATNCSHVSLADLAPDAAAPPDGSMRMW